MIHYTGSLYITHTVLNTLRWNMDFRDSVLYLTHKIPRGMVTTYGEIAKKCGNVGLARAVGNALNNNTRPVEIPCHRVVCSDGSIGGYTGGIAEKISLLKKEGIVVKSNRIVDFEKVLFKFT